MIRIVSAASAAVLVLGACSHQPGASPPSGSASETAGPGAAAPVPTAIPEAMRGRWGMSPADCDPKRADAKGLIEIGADTLRFYEARGKLGAVSAGDDTSIRATYAMTGEGMSWSRDQTLELRDDGRTLMRQEFGKDAIPGPLTYHRCH